MAKSSTKERESFLAEPHIAAPSVSAGPDRGPLTVPIWYQYEPGGEVWILTEAASRKAQLIEEAGRFSLMVERVAPTTRYVSVEGPVTRTIPETDELLLEITERYLPPGQVQDYPKRARAELGAQIVIHMRPQRWLSSDLGWSFVQDRATAGTGTRTPRSGRARSQFFGDVVEPGEDQWAWPSPARGAEWHRAAARRAGGRRPGAS
jgi:hypothetical protein